MIDSALVETLVQDCLERESFSETMYLDRRGFVTVGIGNMLPSVDSATKLPFIVDDDGGDLSRWKRAVQDDYRRVSVMPPGLPAHSYAAPSSPKLRMSSAVNLCRQRVTMEFLPSLRGLSLDVDAYPAPAVRALVAMAYCLGIHGLASFQRMLSRCRMLDFAGAALQSEMKGARAETNAKHERWFMLAAQELREKRNSS
jgi:GH24 family phage-related lysozyme (muramidase)